jgi:ketosteroid isomerase-like protein
LSDVFRLLLKLSGNNSFSMSAEANKILMQHIFSELSNGNDQPFLDAMAEEMQWHWMGSGPWSKTFNGKAAVIGELWAAVRTTLKPPYKVVARRFIADGDFVVVEAVGQNRTPDGKSYDNRYCWVLRIEGGMIRELSEYMDTDLVTRTFL